MADHSNQPAPEEDPPKPESDAWTGPVADDDDPSWTSPGESEDAAAPNALDDIVTVDDEWA